MTHVVLSPGGAVRGAMLGHPGLPGPPGPPGHKGEPGASGAGAGAWNLDSADYSTMAVRVTDYIKCRWRLVKNHAKKITKFSLIPSTLTLFYLLLCIIYIYNLILI